MDPGNGSHGKEGAMKRHNVIGAALAGVSACAMMLTGAPAMAADATPSWAVNSVFAKGLSAFY